MSDSSRDLGKCECCGQNKKEWKEQITVGLARSLAKLHNAVREKGINDVYTGDVNNQETVKFTHSEKCNWTKLKYHGLVFKVKDLSTKEFLSAHYGITQRGYDFLHKGLKVHKYVWSFNGHISDADDARSLELVSLSDVIKKDVNFQTIEEFEGRPHEPTQSSLL